MHDRHQATHFPLYYGEQQDHSRESSYWTLPGSRTGGALQEYNTWTDPELCAPVSSYFPFNLDRHTQQHQDLGGYQPHEAREWTAAQQTARDYERGFLREGWQRRWDPCSPIRYHRDVSSKRSDSSYRELEAWAARYSHSLPRRRRIEAELRGASHGLLENSRASVRDSRSGTDPQLALQQVRQSANIRGSGVWDRRDQPPTLTYYPQQAPALDISQILDVKEKTGYQTTMLSQPPGYIAPPPYNSPQKSSPVMPHCDTSWKQEGTRQTYWSQPILRKKETSVELNYKKNKDKEVLAKPSVNKTCAQLDGIKQRRQEADNSQAGSPVSVTPMQHESTLSLQQPQMIQTLQNTKTNKQTPSKIIEGRKFRVNKKTGGLTIFCLVSRIAGVTETPSLPLCISQTNIQNSDLGGESKELQHTNDNEINLADEVDFRAPILTEQSDYSKVKAATTYTENEMPAENVSNMEESGNVFPEKTNLTDKNAESTQPMSVKYPLWKEPCFTSRAETESSPTALGAQSVRGEPEGPQNQEECVMVHPAEFRRADIQDTESKDSKGLLIIDTTCVVVKMELIQPPKKEHVHYLGYTAQDEHTLSINSTASPESRNQDVAIEQDTETEILQINHSPARNQCSDPTEEKPKDLSEISFLCMPTSSVSETLEERAQRILGIPLNGCVTKQQPVDATSFIDSNIQEITEEARPSSTANYFPDVVSQIPEDTTDPSDAGQTCLKETDDAKDQVTNEDMQGLAGSQEEAFTISVEDNNDSQLETKVIDTQLESLSEEGEPEQSQGENLSAINDPFFLHLNPSKDISKSSLLSDSDLTALLCTSESDKEEHFELAACDACAETSPFSQLPSPLPPQSTESSPSSSPHTDHCQSPPLSSPFISLDQTAEATLCSENQDEISPIVEYNINSIGDFAKDKKDEVMERQSRHDQPLDPDCMEKSKTTAAQPTKEADPLDVLEQTETHIENAIDMILKLQFKCVKANDHACVKESYKTEKEMTEMTSSQDNVIGSQSLIEANMVQKHDGNDEEEDASCVRERCMTEEPLQKGVDDDHARLSEQIMFNTRGSEFLQHVEPQPEHSGLEVSQISFDVLSSSELPSPHMSDTESVSLVEMNSECPSTCLDSDGSTKTAHLPLYLDSSEQSINFLSPPLLSSSCSSSGQKGGESVFVDFPDKEQSQHPKSLWDAVNRIRKHTAPDSENEEEEASEAWDPENLGEDLGVQDVAVDINSRKMIFDEAGQQEFSIERSDEDVEMGQIPQDPGHAEEDTMSCSSTSTHSSGDTVIVAEEDEVEESIFDEETDDKMGTDGDFHKVENISRELPDRNTDEEDEEEQRDTGEFCLSEACTDVEKITAEVVETSKPEQKDNEDIFTPPEVAVVSDEVKAKGITQSL